MARKTDRDVETVRGTLGELVTCWPDECRDCDNRDGCRTLRAGRALKRLEARARKETKATIAPASGEKVRTRKS